MNKIVFLDRDGTIIREPLDCQIDSLEKLEFVPGIIRGLRLLSDAGFRLVMVSNQDGLGTRKYPIQKFELVQGKILNLLKGEGIQFDAIFICPHRPKERCSCRKPKTGLFKNYLKKNHVDQSGSFTLGDRETDVELAKNLGVRSVRLTNEKTAADFVTEDAYEACRIIVRAARSATVSRKTRETEVSVCVALDGHGENSISTGINFFDHMLAQISRHSLMDVRIRAQGDLEVDEHHTVEDVGIVLGKALRQALGSKRGIGRFGFVAPLDEAHAEVAVDLSGRSYLSFRCELRRERIGDMPSELFEDFFKAFADGLGAAIHIRCTGRNDHHKIEAVFKSLAQALKQAIRLESSIIPSTKESL